MFSNKKKTTTFDSKSNNPQNITTIIADDCKVEGTIECKAYIKVDGYALGGVNSQGGVTIGQNGLVKGDIKTKELIVFGRVEGDIYADSLILKNTGYILGNINIKNFQVEPGAVYKGAVSMENNTATPNENSSANNSTKNQPSNQPSKPLEITKK